MWGQATVEDEKVKAAPGEGKKERSITVLVAYVRLEGSKDGRRDSRMKRSK